MFCFFFLISTCSDFQSPAIFTPYVDNVVNFCGLGFFESMLEPHAMDAAAMSPTDVRYIFVILGSVYFVGMNFAGYVSDWPDIFLKGIIWRLLSVLWSFLISCHNIHFGKYADGNMSTSGWSSAVAQLGPIKELIFHMWSSHRFWTFSGDVKQRDSQCNIPSFQRLARLIMQK